MRPLPKDEYTRSIVQVSRDWINRKGFSVLDEYKNLLSIPNIATDLKNIKRNGELLVKMFEKRDFDMKLLEIAGAPPIVYGEHKVPNATRTLCFYAHYHINGTGRFVKMTAFQAWSIQEWCSHNTPDFDHNDRRNGNPKMSGLMEAHCHISPPAPGHVYPSKEET